jgi:RNA polymerase sigma factor (TIGR02999 family)
MNEKGCHKSPVFFAMSETPPSDVMAVVEAAEAGDPEAAGRLLPLVYSELRKLAGAWMRKMPPGQTLQPTALVHEAYLRLLGKRDLNLNGRRHFFFAAARAMRDILVEQARKKAGPQRGGDRRRVELGENLAALEPAADNVLAVSEALDELEREDPLKAQLVKLRYFAGMNMEEAAHVLEISQRTAHRHWRFVKAWLRARL